MVRAGRGENQGWGHGREELGLSSAQGRVAGRLRVPGGEGAARDYTGKIGTI